MKSRSFTTTLMALLLCFCMVFGLTACGGFTQDDIDKAVNDATTPLNEQISALEADIAEKTAKITTLESEKAALVTEKGELEDDITSLEAEKAALEDDKAELEDEVETLEAEKKALTDENTELEASITSKNAEIATLTSSVSSLEAEKTTLNGRVSELNAQITTLNQRITELEESGEADGTEITELKAKVSTLEGEKSTLNARVTELEGTITDKNATIADLEANVETLTSEKATLEGQITTLNGTITEKNNQIATLNSYISTLETEKADLAAKVTELEASITAKETQIADLNSSITTLQGEKQTLTDRVTALKNENAALKNCVKGNHVAGTYSKTETTHTYTCTVCGTEITEEHEYIERACVCGAEIEESNVTDMKNTLYKGNTYTLQNNLTLSENASVAATGKAPVLNLNGNTILTNNHSFKWLGGDLTINGSGAFVGNYVNGGVFDVQGADVTLRLVGNIAITNTAENGYHIVWNKSTLDLSDYTGEALTIYNIGLDAQPTSKIVLPDGWNLYHADGTAFAENETIASEEVFTAKKTVTVKVDFYIGGVELLSEDTAVSEGVLAYYQNNGTVTTTEPTSWNAKLEYNASNGFTLTLNNLQASGNTGSELNTACAIRVNSTESNEPLTIILYGTNTLNAVSEDAYAGLCATTGNLTISGTGSLHVNCEGWYGIYTCWGYAGNNLSIEGGEISFSGSTGSCNSSIESVSTYENAVVLVGDDAATATTWDGTTHLSNYKYVSVKYS